MQLSASYEFLPKSRSTGTAIVMNHFGVDFEQGRHIIANALDIPIQPGQVVLFTGPSGSGKSSLMRAAAKQLKEESSKRANDCDQTGSNLQDLDELVLPRRPLIDALPVPTSAGMELLSACGLGEAHLMLRLPSELSDGQRYRFRMAFALARKPRWIVADEFTATLDRTLAKVIAFNIRRVSDRMRTGFLLATTHEDIVQDLSPDLHIRCHLDRAPEVSPGQHSSLNEPAVKKKTSPSSIPFGSLERPSATGRTSLGGITAAMGSA